MTVKASASITLTRVNDGATGPAGIGIKSVDVEYYLSTSSTTQSGGSWSTTAPAWVNGKYMWSRTKTVTTDGTIKYSNPACITGQKGSTGATGATGSTGATGPTGATGQGVQSITEEYYLSTSKTSQSGGSWVTTPPTWSTGKYIWTRSKIVYKNPTATVYTTPVCDSSWEAVNEVQIGGRNLILNSALNGASNWTGTVSVDTSKKIGNCNSLKFTGSASAYSSSTPAKVGDVFTVSVKSFVGTSGGNLPLIIFEEYKDNTTTRINYQETTVSSTLNSWQTCTKTWTVKNAETTNVRIRIYNRTASYNFWTCQPKLERGNKATDWTPAPEDLDSTFDGIYDLITDKEVKITQSYQTDLQLLEKNIQLSVSETYAEKSAVSTIEKNLTSKIDQTAKDVTINFNKVNNETRGELQNFKTEVNSYIKFDEDGMELGKSNSKFKTKLTNEKLAFLEDGSEIASISNKEMSITDANITNQLTIGKFAFVPRSNGNTSLKWIG